MGKCWQSDFFNLFAFSLSKKYLNGEIYMKKKKFLMSLLIINLIFGSIPLPALAGTVQPELTNMLTGSPNEFNKGDATLESMFQFHKDIPRYNWGPEVPEPATLKGVTYTLADNVVTVNSDTTKNIKSVQQVLNQNSTTTESIGRVISQGGLVKADQLKNTAGISALKPGTVFVDLENDLAFKVPTIPGELGDQFQGYVPVVRPTMQESIKSFDIPQQKVQLKNANVTHFVKDANGNSLDKYLKKPGQTHVMSQNANMEPLKPTHLENIIAEFNFPEEGVGLKGTLPSGGEVLVNVKGYLALGDMALDGYYHKWDYAFYFSVAEELQLQATLAAQLKEEVRIPILGVDVAFDSKIGSIAGGLFLVVGVDGKFTLQIESRQWMKLNKVGLKGKNAYYVPYTIKPFREFGPYGFDLDSHFNGAINGYVKAGALLELSLLGLDIVGAGVFAGMGASTAISGDYVEADLYGIVQAYIKFLGKHKNIINWTPTILQKKQANNAGYIVTFKEACAYRDEVWGNLQFDSGVKGNLPEKDKDVTLIVKNALGNEKSYYKKTDDKGDFHFTGVNLQKDDKITLYLKEKYSTNYVRSAPINPTFPFNKVFVTEVDFFNDYVSGYLPSVIVKNWSNEENQEITFDQSKSQNSSIKLKISQNEYPVILDSQGYFKLDLTNVTPQNTASVELTFDDWVINSSKVVPTVDFKAELVRTPISYEKTIENTKPVDITKLLETVVITNMRGTKVYDGDAALTVKGYTQDAIGCYLINPDTGLPILQAFGLPEQTQPVKLYPLQGDVDESFGASNFTNTVVKKWYWEAKPTKVTATPAISTTPTPIIRPVITPVIPHITLPKATRTITTTPEVGFRTISIDKTKPILLALSQNNEMPALNTNYIQPKESNLENLLSDMPQNSFTLSYDEKFDKYEDYPYDHYSQLADGSYSMKWDDKIVIIYEGAEIILEVKDERRDSSGDPKFETLSSEWSDKNVEGMLNRYIDKMGGALVFPMPDELGKLKGISNITNIPSWSVKSVQKMVDTGIMDLGSGQTFKTGIVNRSECAAYLVHGFGINQDMKQSVFSDIVPSNPYIPEINAAVTSGLINGYNKDTFGPKDPVTREQLAVIIIKGLKYKLGNKLSLPIAKKEFTDKEFFSSWSANAIYEVSSLGIMNGYPDGSFRSKGNVTFNEMAVILNNVQNF